ncbi:IS110 family transposase [Bacillus sp. NP157]|nr:IS110 family transposase [Bacillus sp. NP157]QWT19202.1 IS110 family transposase [Bacillus sp. NP157]QWT20295.1 IS110 family transposase [Bacillus sp. NP157]QWT20819.1 IS110 family transposase [Bacillus sp. NP157]QWT21125.1 IS110 family transposase [Bacillus sp. NP157]
MSIGLDVSARDCAVASYDNGKGVALGKFEQTPAGHARLARKLLDLRPSWVVMEATGIYHLDLAIALDRAGLPVSVINPRSAKRFAQLKLKGTKTDTIDAGLLAEYGEALKPARWIAPEQADLALRDLGRQVNRLLGERVRAKNRLHALTAKKGTHVLLLEDETEAVATLDRRIERLRGAMRQQIDTDPVRQAQLRHMTAAPGIAEVSAMAVLAELAMLPSTMKAPQVSRHAGLDVCHTQSGTSVHGRPRLSKGGNTYLRAGMYMPALVAVRYDPLVKAFYEQLLRRGKAKRQALAAVMRKYLTGLWACLRDNENFDVTKLFSPEHLRQG